MISIIFPREGKLWNFGGTHEIHKQFLTGSTYWRYMGWKGRERRRGYGPRPSVLMDINNLGEKESKIQGVLEVHFAILLAPHEAVSILEAQFQHRTVSCEE